MQLRSDTIVALSTAAGRSAIAVVRLSGPEAHDWGRQLCDRWPQRARVSVHTRLREPASRRELDDALVTRFDHPHSYTGEDLVEFSCHGGMAVYQDLMLELISLGARPAEAGEFTQRAVLNGKLDLLQAEAIADLVDATTSVHRQLALHQLHGSLSALIQELREAILHVEALLVYDVDFPEEDDGPIARGRIADAAHHVEQRIAHLIETAPMGEVAREGALVVVAGPPNAGKSSLFNALVGEERAIVTEIAGTTRDAIEVRIPHQPWPLRLVDTAGLRDTSDRIEKLGIEVSERHLAAAHLVIACGESARDLEAASERVRLLTDVPVIAVLTKADLSKPVPAGGVIAVSALTRQGLDTLLGRVDEELGRSLGTLPEDGAVVMRARQKAGLETAREELREFIHAWNSAELPGAISAIHIRAAASALDDLIGTIDIEQVLDQVFRTFCVGK